LPITKSISRLVFSSSLDMVKYSVIASRQEGWQEFQRENVQFSMNFNEGIILSIFSRRIIFWTAKKKQLENRAEVNFRRP